MMKLYLNDTSPFARFVLAVALEVEIEDIQFCWVDPWESPNSLIEINPFSTVPVLKLDTNVVIFESLFICKYFIEQGEKNNFIQPYDANDLSRFSVGKTLMEMAFRNVILSRFVAKYEDCELYVRSKTSIERALIGIDRVFQAPPVKDKFSNLLMPDLCLALAISYINFRVPSFLEKNVSGNTLEKLHQWENRPSFKLTAPQSLKIKPKSLFELKA